MRLGGEGKRKAFSLVLAHVTLSQGIVLGGLSQVESSHGLDAFLFAFLHYRSDGGESASAEAIGAKLYCRFGEAWVMTLPLRDVGGLLLEEGGGLLDLGVANPS